jgi:threonine dehydrogenase-like Zn-dependent dehydrogenase
MRALLMTEVGQLELREVPDPEEAPPGWVTIRTLATSAGLFHTQMLKGVLDPGGLPRILGHEIVGEVVASSNSASVGGLAVVDPVIGCGACPWCINGDENMCPDMHHLGIDLDGGFAEYVLVPEGNVFGIPAGTPIQEAIMLCSVLPASTHAVRRSAMGHGARVVVSGIGSIGLAVCQLVRALGAATVIAADVSDERLETAAPWVDGSLNIKAMDTAEAVASLRQLGGEPEGVDLAFDTAGARTSLDTAIQVVRPGGTALLMGLIDGPVAIEFADYMSSFMRRELTIRSTFGFTRKDFLIGNALYVGGRLDLRPLGGDVIPLEGVPEALATIGRVGTGGKRYVVHVADA